jgi:ribonuclease P protein component
LQAIPPDGFFVEKTGMKAFAFPKEERLCGKKQIDELFASGKKFNLPLFRLAWQWQEVPSDSPCHPVRILISVPKRKFRRAHDRNRLKRQIREAWRLSRNPLKEKISSLSSENKMKALHIAFLYQSDVKADWPVLLQAMTNAVSIFSKKAFD